MCDREIIALDSLSAPLDGINLVEAAAGTGKTYNIKNLAARMILETDWQISELVILSFTNEAAGELSKGIRSILEHLAAILDGHSASPDEQALQLLEYERKTHPETDDRTRLQKIRNAIRDFDLANISTINGFCQTVLTSYAFESRLAFRAVLESSGSKYLKDILDDWFRKKLYSDTPESHICSALLSRDKLYALIPGILDFNAAVPDLDISGAEAVFNAFIESCGDGSVLELLTPEMFRSGAKIISRKEALAEAIRDRDYGQLLELCPIYESSDVKRKALKAHKEIVERIVDENRFFDCCTELFKIKDSLFPALCADALNYARSRFIELEKELNFMTFADQIRLVDEALNDSAPLREILQKKFKAGIIDEFQDTDSAQYRIFSTLFSGKESCVFLVGDPRQAIYRFRGGDIHAYLAAKDDAMTGGRVYKLDVNYRSSAGMVKAVNRLFAKRQHPFGSASIDFPELKHRPPEQAPELLHDGTAAAEAVLRYECPAESGSAFYQCACRISELLSSASKEMIVELADGAVSPRKILPGDIAVLVRSHNDGAQMMAELERLNIPAVSLKSGNVYASYEARELYQVLNAAAFFREQLLVSTALGTSLCGIPLEKLDYSVDGGSSPEVERGKNVLYQMGILWRSRGFSAMLEYFLQQFDVRCNLAKQSGGERKLTNLFQLEELLQSLSIRSKLAPEALMEQFSELIFESSDRSALAEEHEELMSSGGSAVRVMTIHASKGLQFPLVMLPQLDKLKLKPGSRIGMAHCCRGRRELDLSGEFREVINSEMTDEYFRLIYVALTRAQYRCEIFEAGLTSGSPWDRILNGDGALESRIPLKQCNFREIFFTRSSQGELVGDIPAVPPFQPDWQVVSYTFLAGDANARGSDLPLDHDETAPEQGSCETGGGFSPFSCPGGAGFGTALHEIFERIDFAGGKNSFVQAARRLFPAGEQGELPENFHQDAGKWMYDIFHTPLDDCDGNSFTLSEISSSDRISEMEFCCRFGSFDLKGVRKVLDEYVRSGELGLQEWPEMWDRHLDGGILNGFIDLIFRRNGKYYIVDWKSNKLGDMPEDFSAPSLARAMVHSLYFLQYLLYMAALVRHLRRFIPGGVFGEAEYRRMVGGVYYLFVRGMSPSAPGRGVFYALPPWKVVNALEELLCSKKS